MNVTLVAQVRREVLKLPYHRVDLVFCLIRRDVRCALDGIDLLLHALEQAVHTRGQMIWIICRHHVLDRASDGGAAVALVINSVGLVHGLNVVG